MPRKQVEQRDSESEEVSDGEYEYVNPSPTTAPVEAAAPASSKAKSNSKPVSSPASHQAKPQKKSDDDDEEEEEEEEEDKEPLLHFPALSFTSPSSYLAYWRIDLRGIAFLRMAIGTIVLLDIWNRLAEYTLFYAPDAEIIPLADAKPEFPAQYSLFFLLPTTVPLNLQHAYTLGLFAVGLLASISLILGFYSQLSVLLLFILEVSIQNRAAALCNKGDMVLRCYLFWMNFLPLAAKWSYDAVGKDVVQYVPHAPVAAPRQSDKKKGSKAKDAHAAIPSSSSYAVAAIDTDSTLHGSVGVTGFIFQVFFLYIFNALLKLEGAQWWKEGTATYYALNGFDVITRFGLFIKDSVSYELMQVTTWAVVILELVGPFFLVSRRPGFVQLLSTLAFALLHLSFLLSMNLGIFQYVCLVGIAAFLPPFVWDRVEKQLKNYCKSCTASSSSTTKSRWIINPSAFKGTLAFVAVIFIFLWNLSLYPTFVGRIAPFLYSFARAGSPTHTLGRGIGIHQVFDMYAPFPYRTSGWLVSRGLVHDREYYVDIKRSLESGFIREIEWGMPGGRSPGEIVSDHFRSARWGKLLMLLGAEDKLRANYGKWLCKEWYRALHRNPRHGWFIPAANVSADDHESTSGTEFDWDRAERLVRSLLWPWMKPPAEFGDVNFPLSRLSELDLYYLTIDTPTVETAKANAVAKKNTEVKWRWIGKYQCFP